MLEAVFPYRSPTLSQVLFQNGFTIMFSLLIYYFYSTNVRQLSPDPYRILEFKQATAFQSWRLNNHVIRSIDNVDVDSCELLCLLEDNCVSLNSWTSKIQSKGTICELNNSTHVAHPDDFKKLENYIYRGIKVRKKIYNDISSTYLSKL